ncbi:MAG: hypothetical protein KIT09_27630 [Bryobacteraceae bacterium]|nr:hypothetical protein [Bryobacteraceae bacterium]
MRYFFRRRVPDFTGVLLIESGARALMETLIPKLRHKLAPSARVDLLTCYPGVPSTFPRFAGQVYRVTDYPGRRSRRRLYRQLDANAYVVAVILCSGEPIMTRWKWMMAFRLPAKILIVNENVDYFWLDYSNWRIALHVALFRAGFTGAGVVSSVARLFLFPFTFVYLLLYTAIVHLRRRKASTT